MKTALLKSIGGLMLLIMIVSMACNIGASPTATQVPTEIVPTNTPVPSPTETLPPPTPTATQVPPTPTTLPATDTPQAIEEYYPQYCSASTTYGYMSCMDADGSIMLDIPDYWIDVESGDWLMEGIPIGKAINAAPDLVDFNDSYTAEGIFFGASDDFALYGGYVQFLDIFTSIYTGSCDFVGRYDYSDAYYRGKYDQYEDCGGSGGYDAYVLSAVDKEDQYSKIILMYIQVLPGDTMTVNQIWQTFLVFDL